MLSTRAHRVVRQCDFAGRISPDSRLGVRNDHIFGAHAPDAHEVELADLGGLDLGAKLLEAMGADLGAIHAAHRRREQVLVDVQRRDPRWLEQATKAAEEYVRRETEVKKALADIEARAFEIEADAKARAKPRSTRRVCAATR